MTAYPAWTPASRPGIIPLHPLSFGTILGRSFAALRQNPKVLLGFALVVQTLAYLVVIVAVAGVAIASFTRLDTLTPGTEEFDTVLAGSVAITLIAGIVLGLAAGALGVIVQGIVVVEVTHAAVAEKLTLGALWQQVKPIVWRLIGYALVLTLAVIAAVAVAVVALVAIGIASPPIAIGLTVLVILGSIPLIYWLTIKLLLAPAAIIIEHATIGQAIVRSWTLIRGRFWVALGVILVISLVFGAVAQVVSIPMTFLSTGLTTVLAPTGDPTVSEMIGVVVVLLTTQVLTLLLQAVLVVVQSSATALIYIDCRMRREGLDLDLLAYVERRDSGADGLPDPYRQHIGRTITVRQGPGTVPPQYPPYGQPQQYAQPVYGPPTTVYPQRTTRTGDLHVVDLDAVGDRQREVDGEPVGE
uniref:hypothetical protein n=1 Tax=Microbacterium sp. 2FI TaxID=2502193 RepID=UPI0020175188